MPYFERKPWTAPVTEPPRSTAPETDMAEIAQSVLSAEAQAPHAIEGPFRCSAPVAPGGNGHIALRIDVQDGDAPVVLDLAANDLRSVGGESLAASLLTLTPDAVRIFPGQSETVHVALTVPLTTKPGLYTGRVIARGSETMDFVVEFEIAPKS